MYVTILTYLHTVSTYEMDKNSNCLAKIGKWVQMLLLKFIYPRKIRRKQKCVTKFCAGLTPA